MGPQGLLAAPPKDPVGIPVETDDDADMLGETEQAVKKKKVEALPTDPSVMRERLLMMRELGSPEESRGSNEGAVQLGVNVHSVVTDTATPLG